MNLRPAIDFINECRRLGYEIDGNGTAMQINFTGRYFKVVFRVRPMNFNPERNEYELPGRCGSGKHEDFNQALRLAIEDATRGER